MDAASDSTGMDSGIRRIGMNSDLWIAGMCSAIRCFGMDSEVDLAGMDSALLLRGMGSNRRFFPSGLGPLQDSDRVPRVGSGKRVFRSSGLDK